MTEKLKIKIEKSLGFLINTLKSNYIDNYEIAEESPDLLICEKIPSADSLFIVVWDKHDISEIQKATSHLNNSHKNLRGFFIKKEVQKNPSSFVETITDVQNECNRLKSLKKTAEEVIKDNAYFEIGSLVKITPQSGKRLESEYSSPRFTTLFIDKPMIDLMSSLCSILQEMVGAITSLNNDYSIYIDGKNSIKKTRGLEEKKDDFSLAMVQTLSALGKNKPIKIEPILLTGDTGVGKTLIARWIYETAGFKGAFEECNASAFSEERLESELFGHVKGAWTDAKCTKPGKALLALGGVLFLDEIGDMPINVQPKVLKFIEDKTFTPEGWAHNEQFYSPMLIIGATNKNIEDEINKGRFRHDLYARFKHQVRVPSIIERKDSFNAIVDMLLQNPLVNPKDDARNHIIKYVSYKALEKLKGMGYPENFRGLERVVRDAAYKTRDLGLNIILAEAIDKK